MEFVLGMRSEHTSTDRDVVDDTPNLNVFDYESSEWLKEFGGFL